MRTGPCKLVVIGFSCSVALSPFGLGQSKDAGSQLDALAAARKMAIQQGLAKLPMAFEINRGQAEPSVKFLSRGSNSMLFLTGKEAILDVFKAESLSNSADLASGRSRFDRTAPRISHSVLRMGLVGAKDNAEAVGEGELSGKVSYFAGNDSRHWHSGISTYEKVRYHDVYSGIDLAYYGNQDGRIEHDFIVKPGGNPLQIVLRFGTQQNPRIDSAGDLVLNQGGDEFRLSRPEAYQEIAGTRRSIAAQYSVANNEVRFTLGDYDKSHELVIDPVLLFSTAVAGPVSYGEAGLGVSVALDPAGNIYLAGMTYYGNCGHGELCVPGNRSGTLTECTGPILQQNNGNCVAAPADSAYPEDNLDVWVLKLDPTATSVLYGVYLGAGNGGDVGNYRVNGLGVDATGRAVIGGTGGIGIPITPNAWQTTGSGSEIGFVTMLTPDGSGIVYSTFVDDGTSAEGTRVYAVAVDSGGRIYTTGATYQGGWRVNGFQSGCTSTGSTDGSCYPSAFIAKFDPSLSGASSLAYFSYLGGSGIGLGSGDTRYFQPPVDTGFGIAVDSNQNAYVTGYTNSPGFPVTGTAYQNTFGDDACLAGAYHDAGSNTWVFPSSNCETNASGGTVIADAFFAKVNTTTTGPSSLAYSTFLGGLGYDEGTGVAVDSAGFAYVTGVTCSPFQNGALTYPNTDSSFFVPTCPFLAQSISGSAVVTKLDTSRSNEQSLVYSTYLGLPSGESTGNAVAVDQSGNAFVVGDGNVPLVHSLSNASSGFVTKLNPAGAILFSTNLPGMNWGILERNGPGSVAIDSGGNAYVASIGDTSFPWYNNLGVAPSSLSTAYITKINSADVAGMLSSPGSLNFGAQNVGTTSGTLYVNLNSVGSQPLTITNLQSDNPEFSVDSSYVQTYCLAIQFSAFQGCSIPVTFTPASTGQRTGNLVVTDDTTGGTQSVPLAGTGVSPTLATTTSIVAPTIIYGSAAGVTVSVTSAQSTVTGSVSLTVDGGAPLTQALSNGSGSFSISGLNAGSHSLSANYAAQGNFDASSATGALQVNQAIPTISISNIPINAVYRGSFILAYTYTGDGTPSTVSNTPATCTVIGSTVMFVSAGTCTLTAKATAGTNYVALTGSPQSFTIAQAHPTINISNIPASAQYGGSFTPAFSYSGDGVTSVTSSTTFICMVSGTSVAFIGIGTCTLTAHATATVNSTSATGSPQAFNVAQATPSISINNLPANPVYGGSFTPTFAYSGNGKTSSTSSPAVTCTVSNKGVVSFVGTGSCYLTARATATTNYAAATGPVQSFIVTQAKTTISIKNIPSKPKRGTSFTPAYSYVGDGTPSATSSTPSICTVSGNVVNFIAAGSCTLTAQATAGIDYAATTGNPQTFTVK